MSFHVTDYHMIPVGLVSDAERLDVLEDTSAWIHMRSAYGQSELADIDLDYEDEEPVHPRKSRKMRRTRADRRRANVAHKLRDRYHGKRGKESMYAGEYADRGYRLYVSGGRDFVDPIEASARPVNVHVHHDTAPIPEQEPFYVGIYETREVCDGVNVTMEWALPEAVEDDWDDFDFHNPRPFSDEERQDYLKYCMDKISDWMETAKRIMTANAEQAEILRDDLYEDKWDYYNH